MQSTFGVLVSNVGRKHATYLLPSVLAISPNVIHTMIHFLPRQVRGACDGQAG